MAFLSPGSAIPPLGAPSVLNGLRDPLPTDDNSAGFQFFSMYLNVLTWVLWICVNPLVGNATWIKVGNTSTTQIFSASGACAYTPPPNAKAIRIQGVAPGGGGGSGYCGSGALGGFYGGGGGAAGSSIDATYPIANLSGPTISFTMPGPGSGGAAQTTSSSVGNSGVAGGNITINSSGLQCFVQGGAGGSGGSLTAGMGGITALATMMIGGNGAAAALSNILSGGNSLGIGGGGGGAGGSVNLGSASGGSNGGAGSLPYGNQAGGAGGGPNSSGSNGASVTTSMPGGGSGGGGGGASSSGTGKAGGAGGNYGAGGGGGGATSAGLGSGAGGAGAPGILLFTSIG